LSTGTTSSGVDANNQVYMWGNGNYGLIANNLAPSALSYPTMLIAGLDITNNSPVQVASGSWSQINAGVNTNMAVDNNGSLYSWGLNDQRQTGVPSSAKIVSSPVQIGTQTVEAGTGNATGGAINRY
jgi:alpha-tubulin suppressor-like RCC1 family protein